MRRLTIIFARLGRTLARSKTRAVMHGFPPLFVLLVACGGSGYEAPTSGPPAIGNASSDDKSCSRDSECTLVADCCGCARRGRRQAVNVDRVEALESRAEEDCAEAHCPVGESEHRSCTAESARCLGGRCVPLVR